MLYQLSYAPVQVPRGHCTQRSRSIGPWRLSVLKTLHETYSSPPESASLLGPVAIEELNIMEGWLQKKGAKKAFVTPPRSPEDAPALERMMALVEGWVNPPPEGAANRLDEASKMG